MRHGNVLSSGEQFPEPSLLGKSVVRLFEMQFSTLLLNPHCFTQKRRNENEPPLWVLVHKPDRPRRLAAAHDGIHHSNHDIPPQISVVPSNRIYI